MPARLDDFPNLRVHAFYRIRRRILPPGAAARSSNLVYNFSDKDAQFGFGGIGASPALNVGTW
jgi:hypothetical protein